MLDDFFIRAIVGGIGVAVVAGPLGCFVIWRRLAYFGDTLSHSALLGVALALLLELNITFTVFCISVVVAMLLMLLQRRASLSSDALLGLARAFSACRWISSFSLHDLGKGGLDGISIRRYSCNYKSRLNDDLVWGSCGTYCFN